MEKAKDIKVLEIVAYTLFEKGLSDKSQLEQWRTSASVREKYRDHAQGIVDALEDQGVHINSRAAKKLDEALEAIITVPAVKAYDLESEFGTNESSSYSEAADED